jgi:carboxypeptidase family protein
MRALRIARVLLVGSFVVWSTPAWAQTATSGTIAGGVTDTSGAVLPCVTVEAASPALIEKVRAVVTDGQSRYTIVELRPATYTVTFSFPGFSSVRREGLELPTGFTATVNAQLPVGAVTETITVTGASPVVDVQSTRTQTGH